MFDILCILRLTTLKQFLVMKIYGKLIKVSVSCKVDRKINWNETFISKKKQKNIKGPGGP